MHKRYKLKVYYARFPQYPDIYLFVRDRKTWIYNLSASPSGICKLVFSH